LQYRIVRKQTRFFINVPVKQITISFVRTASVMVGMLVGFVVDKPILGSIDSFAAYLTMASFSRLPDRPRSSVISGGIAVLSLSGLAGASSAHRPVMIIIGGTVFAALQGVLEVIGGPLRMAAAMSALSFLLAGQILTRHITPAQYFALFVLGAIVQGAVTTLTAPVVGKGLRDNLREVRAKLAPARVFTAKMSVIGFVTTLGAAFVPASNAVWLATSALRVANPDVAVLRRRTRNRVVGTFAGGAIAAIALSPALPPWFVVVLVGVAVFAMQLITASRYIWWTLCLTVVALSFIGMHGLRGWEIAGIRFGLTILGAATTLCVLHIGKNASPFRS
jgi:hypothetical protein